MTICKVLMTCVVACYFFSSPAIADGRTSCKQELSVTEKPVFSGLKVTRFPMNTGESSEGGELKIFSDSANMPIYLLVTHYGETGKRVALYKLLLGDHRSFVARVSDYQYMEPIFAAPSKVASVRTSSFIVCKGAALRGVGNNGGLEKVVASAKAEVAQAVQLFSK